MWFVKSFLRNLLAVSLVLCFVGILILIANIGLWWVSLIVVGLILIFLYTLWQGPSIDDYYFDDNGHIKLR